MARAALDPKTANARYHDAAAAGYEQKWAIGFDDASMAYVRERAERMLPRRRYHRVLEVGAGTGFFVLNLWRAGFVGRAHATDISPGMLEVCRANAGRLGCELAAEPGDAEGLPYEDRSFDLVVGHAFLHHVPDPGAALREIRRVLAPGGALFVAGEPTRLGDRLAGMAKALSRRSFRLATALRPLRGLRRRPPEPVTEEDRILQDLEFEVDLHTFDPAEVVAWASDAGFAAVRTETEELLASLFGWAVRTLEGEARPGLFGPRWGRFAYRAWNRLMRLDRALYRMVPGRLFYNLLLYAEKPED